MNFSIGLFAHNEITNFKSSFNSILSQKLDPFWQLKDIVVIVSGSTDGTDLLAKKLAKNHSQIKVIIQKKRLGKVSAVNKFLKSTRSRYLILTNADNRLDKNAINLLLNGLRPANIGMTCGQILPQNNQNSFFGFATNLLWTLHHKINLQFPQRAKAGEMIAFKRLFSRLHSQIPFDEASIEGLIHAQDYKAKYIPQAKVYNWGPDNLKDFFNLRRRNNAGNLVIKRKQGHSVATLSNLRILGVYLANIDFRLKPIFWSFLVILIEATARIVAYIDVLIYGQTHQLWKRIDSTKKDLNLF